jgi:hypothetical protein
LPRSIRGSTPGSRPLPRLGPHRGGFVVWLRSQGYPHLPIRLRIRETSRLDARLRRRGVRQLGVLFLCATSRLRAASLATRQAPGSPGPVAASYFDEHGLLACPAATPHEQMIAAYRAHLDRTRGLANSTATQHCSTASELLAFLGFDRDRTVLRRLGPQQIEALVRTVGGRVCRASLQHVVARLRSFLRFPAGREEVARGLDSLVDTPRLYRGEKLPRSPRWETVQAFLAAIDRSTPRAPRLRDVLAHRDVRPAHERDRSCGWTTSSGQHAGIRVPRPKTQTPIVLPITERTTIHLPRDEVRCIGADRPTEWRRLHPPRGVAY